MTKSTAVPTVLAEPATSQSGRVGRKHVGLGVADALCAIALCILTLLSWIPRWKGPLDLRWDGGTYYVLGTSLAQGKGYRLLNEPGEIRADQYPPLLPAIVAIHQKLLSSSDPVKVGIWLRRTWMLLSVAYVCGAYFLARIFLPRLYSFWLAAFCMLGYDMYYMGTLCFAELPFGLVTVLFAWSYLRDGGGSRSRYLTPAFAIAGYLLRTMGIALLLAWIGDALLRRRFRSAAIRGAIAIAPVVGWLSYVHNVESAPDYKRPYYAYQRDPSMFYNVSYAVNMKLRDPFKPDLGYLTPADLASRFLNNALWIPTTLGQSVTAREGFYKAQANALNKVVGTTVVTYGALKHLFYFLGVMVLLGVLQLMLKQQWLISLTILFTAAAVCTTPWPGQFARYLTPIIPLLMLALTSILGRFKGIARILFLVPAQSRALKWFRIAISTLVVFECAVALRGALRNYLNEAYYWDAQGHRHEYHLLHYSGQYTDTQKALAWLKQGADSNAVLAVTMPQWVYLQSGFKAVIPPLTTNAEEAQRLIDTVPVSFVVVEELLMDDNFNTFFPALVERSPDRWKLLYSKEGSPVKLYARIGTARLSGNVVSQ